MGDWLLVLAGVALTVGTAVFVAGEFSLVALDRPAVEEAIRRGDTRASGVLGSLRQLSTQLSGSQVGITLTTLALGFVTTPAIASLLAGPLASVGVPAGARGSVAQILALVLATVFSMIFGELVPQFFWPVGALGHRQARVGAAALVHDDRPPLHRRPQRLRQHLPCGVGVEPQGEISAARSPPNWPRSSARARPRNHSRGHCPVADRIHRLRGPDGRGRHDPASTGHGSGPHLDGSRCGFPRSIDRPLPLPRAG